MSNICDIYNTSICQFMSSSFSCIFLIYSSTEIFVIPFMLISWSRSHPKKLVASHPDLTLLNAKCRTVVIKILFCCNSMKTELQLQIFSLKFYCLIRSFPDICIISRKQERNVTQSNKTRKNKLGQHQSRTTFNSICFGLG